MPSEVLALQHNTEFVLLDANGKIKKLWNANRLGKLTGLRIPFVTGLYRDSFKSHNLITSAGKAGAVGRMSNQGSYSPFTAIAIGTGTTAAAAGDVALQSEITTGGGARGAATATQTTTTTSNDTALLTKTFTFSASFAISEEGILDNATTGGTLLAHQVFAAINVTSGDSLTISHSYHA